MNLSAFKAYDIRGQYPEEVNEDLAYLVGRALVRYLSAKTIVVGRDMRLSSPSLQKKLIEGITCEGADVIDIGMCTTPMLNFTVANYNYDGGVMVTASHNPADDNAFKLIKGEAIMMDESSGLLDIKTIVEKGFTACPGKGAVTEKDVLSGYLSHLLSFSEGIKPLSIVVDYGNGVGSISAKPLFARLDMEVTELFSEPDGTFPNHPANPQIIDNLKDLIDKVLKEKADLGIAFDGDADRVIFIDDLGRVVPTDLLVTYLAKYAIRRSKEKQVYYDVRSSKIVSKLIKKYGGEPVMMRAGNPFLKEVLKKGGAIAAEFTGHIMYPEILESVMGYSLR